MFKRLRAAFRTPLQEVDDLVEAYGVLLQDQTGPFLRPASCLPATKDRMKGALVARARVAKGAGLLDYVETVKVSYGLLAHFVTDEVSARNPGPSPDRLDGGLNSEDLREWSAEMDRLLLEFDDRVSES